MTIVVINLTTYQYCTYSVLILFFHFQTGGASIKPSARPSIHSHKHCPFAYTEAIMGRYGVNRKNDQEKIAQPSKHIVNLSNDHGIDEVDNVFR